MGKEKKGPKSEREYAEEIRATVLDERRDDIVIIFIPSHDRKQRKLNNQEFWAAGGLKLFCDLYGGATSFRAFRGVWKSDDGTDLYDEPIMIQSLAKRENVVDEKRLELLVAFARDMGSQTNQESVGLIVNDVMHYIYV